ncbi:CotS family spore coat protein [Coprococcus sp. AM25-15LB]|nr:CotS family spore coat protein [Coprococcus sp. AM25-15LB]RJW07748.1 CotS family spore coat protein [Coprococcus sp. AM25-4LB]
MKDFETDVLEQYHIEVKGTRKTRGAILCDTDRGMLLLKELTFSEKRVPLLYKLCHQLEEKGYGLVDTIVPNKEGEYVTSAPDQTKYILKRWYGGRECDVRNEEELCSATANLAYLHNLMAGADVLEEGTVVREHDLKEEYQRHNRELRKVRTFIRNKVGKGEFELLYLKEFEEQHALGEAVVRKLETDHYETLRQKSKTEHTWIHGDYNYHNVLMTYRGVATTNFEHFREDIQMADFYYFLRKVMEKCQWNERIGNMLLEAYDKGNTISREELDYLAVRLAYPEKFWKVANSYYHSNKAWIPEKSVEKLQISIAQTEKKNQFLKDLFSFHL